MSKKIAAVEEPVVDLTGEEMPAAPMATESAAEPAKAPVYLETWTQLVQRGDVMVKATLGRRYVAEHVEEPAGSGRWMDFTREQIDTISEEVVKPKG